MAQFYPWFRLDSLNSFIVLAIGLFSLLILLYSLGFMRKREGLRQYYIYTLLTAIISIATVLANNLILLVVGWGFLGLSLYLLINMGDKDAATAAKKAFIIIGATDSLMLLGIGIIYYLTGTFQMDKIKLSLTGSEPAGLTNLTYICLALACFAKAGAMPLHVWVPDSAKSAPLPVVAYLPASLDKLLGIYLLARISLDLFIISPLMNMFLMLIGAFTLLAAALMALIQQDLKRLLAYLTISGAGYMILGLATSNPVGVSGGLFYMLNSALASSCLFLTFGNVEYTDNALNSEHPGGLRKFMPITFLACLIAGLSISGVPPFNGFASKWMIYQGLINQLGSNGVYQLALVKFIIVLCLLSAMFASGLTLASFMKFIHTLFLRQKAEGRRQKAEVNEVSWTMWFPVASLACLCVVFGVFAIKIPIKYFLLPIFGEINFVGTWFSTAASLLIITGLILGIIIFKLQNLSSLLRQDKAFLGAETRDVRETQVSEKEFYNTIKEFGVLKGLYSQAEAGIFDIYEQGKRVVFGIGKILQYLHNGILPTYLVWSLLGMLGLFLILCK